MNINHHYVQSPSEIITTQLEIPKSEHQIYLDEIYRLHHDKYKEKSSGSYAISSTPFLHQETNVFNSLFDKILERINVSYPPLPNSNYLLINNWFVLYKKGDMCGAHNHSPCYLSFVYYLKSEEFGPLIFDKCNFQITPKDDMLVIFPSYLEHSVAEYKGETDRICLVGNILMSDHFE